MTLRLSTALRNSMASDMSLRRALSGGSLDIYTGAQPASADAAATGTLLCTLTNNAGVFTSEVQAQGSVTLTGGASGSVNTLTVNGIDILGGAVNFITSLSITASAVAAQINNKNKQVDYTASTNGAIIIITAMPGTGTMPNGFVVASTTTTLTKTDANMAGGVAGVNGLTFDVSAADVLSKTAAQVWSGINVASGTAGWFRYTAAAADPDTLDNAFVYKRIDGAVGVTGAELNLTSTTFAVGVLSSITVFQLTLPSL